MGIYTVKRHRRDSHSLRLTQLVNNLPPEPMFQKNRQESLNIQFVCPCETHPSDVVVESVVKYSHTASVYLFTNKLWCELPVGYLHVFLLCGLNRAADFERLIHDI